MKVLPIIFSGPMVRALLAGKKTQTRRLATSPLAKVGLGDILYARESFQVPALMEAQYAATPGPRQGHWNPDRGPWRPAIHMPRWASRLTLPVCQKRIEPLQDISAEDCIAEGIDYEQHKCGCEVCSRISVICPATSSSLILAYAELWDKLHGHGSWDENPNIVALTFNVHEKNIDQFLAQQRAAA